MMLIAMPDLSRFDTTNNTNLASCLFAIIIGNGIINLARDLHYPPTRLSQRVLQGTTRALWTVPIIISTHFSQQSDFCDRNVIFALSFYVLGSVVIFALVAACTRLLNGIPGPTFAKLSILWKLTHAYRRTYDAAVRNLHDLHGAIVQVGPYEYSISDSSLFERCAQLQKVSYSFTCLCNLLISSRPTRAARLGSDPRTACVNQSRWRMYSTTSPPSTSRPACFSKQWWAMQPLVRRSTWQT